MQYGAYKTIQEREASIADGSQRTAPMPDEYPSHTFSAAVRVLKAKELVMAHFREGSGMLDVRTTDYGKQYMAEYPHLRNPINWSVVAAISSIATAIATTLALFVGCSYIQ